MDGIKGGSSYQVLTVKPQGPLGQILEQANTTSTLQNKSERKEAAESLAQQFNDKAAFMSNNGEVEILVRNQDATGSAEQSYQIIRGEKIELAELGKANPSFPLDKLKEFDQNEDGFLVESELKMSKSNYIKSFMVLGGLCVGGYTLAGAAAGSVVPVVGTGIGAAAGALTGLGVIAYDAWKSKGQIGQYVTEFNPNKTIQFLR